MGKLRKLRSRFISSVGAVKRSILRMQSQGSTASNSTALTSLTPGGEDDDEPPTTSQASTTRKNAGLSIWRKMPEEDPDRTGQQLKLHWSEGRRIYSEPMHTVDRVSCRRGEQNSCRSSSTSITEVESSSLSNVAASRLVPVASQETAAAAAAAAATVAVAGSTQALALGSAGEIGVVACSLSSDEEENDDVFLESWEDHQRERGVVDFHDCNEEDFLLGDGGSFSGFSSGYSTISNDNLPSPALYLPPPSAEGAGNAAEGEPREGGVSGWDDWRIAESEVSLGPVLTSTEQETTYSGYWHGHVQVRSRRVREVEDLTCFLEEVTTLSCIRHENIQLFMGACLNMQEGVLAIVMSEIKGDTLHTRLHHYGHAFTNPSKIKILSQIAEGMAYLHARGIPHGLLSSSSVSLHFRVCISLAPQYSRSKARQLQPCDIPYLPPECIRELHVSQSRSHIVAFGGPLDPAAGRRRGHSCSSQRKFSTGHFVATQTITGRNEKRACMILLEGRPTLFADIFAFGTIVYELMSLEHPYKSYPLETQIWRVGKGKVQGLMLLARGQLRSVIARCWKETPDHRPGFKDILAMLEQDAIANWTFGSVRSLPCLSSSSTVSMHSPPDTPSIIRNNY